MNENSVILKYHWDPLNCFLSWTRRNWYWWGWGQTHIVCLNITSSHNFIYLSYLQTPVISSFSNHWLKWVGLYKSSCSLDMTINWLYKMASPISNHIASEMKNDHNQGCPFYFSSLHSELSPISTLYNNFLNILYCVLRWPISLFILLMRVNLYLQKSQVAFVRNLALL